MANPKRASMREGPLAALFRKTEGEDGEATAASEPAAASKAPAVEAVTPAAAATSATATATPAAAATPASATPHPRESGLPHPALKGSVDAAEETRADSVPT